MKIKFVALSGMVASDGSEDYEINIQGLDNYTIAGLTADDMESIELAWPSSSSSGPNPFRGFETTDEGDETDSPPVSATGGRRLWNGGGLYGCVRY